MFHAGDGNLHPLILFDANKEGELERAELVCSDILMLCVEVGGVLSGEHGIGVEKRDLMGAMFTEDDLKQQQRVKWQGLSGIAPLCRAWQNARASWQAAVPRHSQVLD